MMPGVRVVLVPVAPFIAAICPGELRAARRACLLAECHGERVVCHLRDPVRCRWPCGWPGGPCVIVAAAPAAGCSRSHSLRSAWTWTVNEAALALVAGVRDDHGVDAGVAAGGRSEAPSRAAAVPLQVRTAKASGAMGATRTVMPDRPRAEGVGRRAAEDLRSRRATLAAGSAAATAAEAGGQRCRAATGRRGGCDGYRAGGGQRDGGGWLAGDRAEYR